MIREADAYLEGSSDFRYLHELSVMHNAAQPLLEGCDTLLDHVRVELAEVLLGKQGRPLLVRGSLLELGHCQ